MSDYASCPACHGSGLVPLEDAERIRVHQAVISEDKQRAWDERKQRERQERAEMVQAELRRRVEAAEARKRRFEELVYSRPAPMWDADREAGP